MDILSFCIKNRTPYAPDDAIGLFPGELAVPPFVGKIDDGQGFCVC